MSEVVEYRQKKIGSDHPHTIQLISTLLNWLDKIKKKGPDRKPLRRDRFPPRLW